MNKLVFVGTKPQFEHFQKIIKGLTGCTYGGEILQHQDIDEILDRLKSCADKPALGIHSDLNYVIVDDKDGLLPRTIAPNVVNIEYYDPDATDDMEKVDRKLLDAVKDLACAKQPVVLAVDDRAQYQLLLQYYKEVHDRVVTDKELVYMTVEQAVKSYIPAIVGVVALVADGYEELMQLYGNVALYPTTCLTATNVDANLAQFVLDCIDNKINQ